MLARAVEHHLTHSASAPGAGIVERLHLRQHERRGQHVERAGKGIEHRGESGEAVAQIKHGQLAHHLVRAGDDLGDGKRAVVRRAQHGEAAAFVPAGAVVFDPGAGHQSAHAVPHQQHRRIAAKPLIDAGLQLVSGVLQFAPPVEVKRLYIGILREAEQHLEIVFPHGAAGIGIILRRAVGLHLQPGNLPKPKPGDVHPHEVFVLPLPHRQLRSHDAVEHYYIGPGPRRAGAPALACGFQTAPAQRLVAVLAQPLL